MNASMFGSYLFDLCEAFVWTASLRPPINFRLVHVLLPSLGNLSASCLSCLLGTQILTESNRPKPFKCLSVSNHLLEMIKKRSRPQPRIREISLEREEEDDGEPKLPYVR